MTKKDSFYLPAGYRLDITADSLASGYYYLQGNPGEPSGGLNNIPAGQTIQVGPFNDIRNYTIVTNSGNITYSKIYEYVQEEIHNLDELTDVVITDILEEDILKWDGDKWVNGFIEGGGGGASDLDDLDDVHIVLPSDGQVLRYADGVWTNEDILSGLVPTSRTVTAGTGMTGGGALSDNITLHCSITQYTDELAQDAVDRMWTNGTFLSKNYIDESNEFILDLSASGTPDNTKFLRGDNTWAVPSAAGVDLSPGYISNNYYLASGIGHAQAAYTNEVFTTGTLYFYPFYVGKTASFKNINVRTVTGSAGNVVLGLYASSGGKPTGSPLENSGSISTAGSNSTLTYTFSSPRSLTGGTWYWLAVSTSSSTPTFVSIGPGSLGYVYTQNFLGCPSLTSADNSIIGWEQAFSYSAALPTVGSLSARANTSKLHCVWLQAN